MATELISNMEPNQDLTLSKFKLMKEEDKSKPPGSSAKIVGDYFHKRLVGMVDTRRGLRIMAKVVDDYKVSAPHSSQL